MKTLKRQADQPGKVLRLSLPDRDSRSLPTLALAVCPDGRHVLSSGLDFYLRLWDLETGTCTHTWDAGGPISSIAVDPQGRWALLGAVRGVIWWDLESWDLHSPFTFWTRKGQITAVAYAAGRGMILSASEDLVIYRWDLRSRRAVKALAGHKRVPSALAVNSRGEIAVSGDTGGELRVWDLESGGCLTAWQGHDDKIADLVISADGQSGTSASHDRLVRLWALPSGECTRTLEGHTKGVTAVAMSAGGRWAISGGDDGLRLWDLEGSQCLDCLDDSRLVALALSPDESHVVASATCDVLSVWPTGPMSAFEGLSSIDLDCRVNGRNIK